MSTITIKDMPPAIHRAFKSRAKAHGRSLNRKILTTLNGVLHSAPVVAPDVEKHARAVRETIGGYLTQNDLSTLKNAGR